MSLSIDRFSKRFSNGKGVGPVSVELPESSITAIIGPNGAGKTTLFTTLAGIQKADAGAARFDGRLLHETPLAQFSFLPDEPALVPRFRILEMCQLDAALRNVPDAEQAVHAALELFECNPFQNERASNCSKGMLKRAGLAMAFVGNPRLIILDEPINALDIQGVLLLKGALKKARSAGAAIILSSHILDFLDDIADTIVFLQHGLIRDSIDPKVVSAETRYQELFC